MTDELLGITEEIKTAAFSMRDEVSAIGDRLSELEKISSATPSTPQAEKRGGLISAILIAGGRQPLRGYERVANEVEKLPDGSVQIPWAYLDSQPQAALTRTHFEGEDVRLMPDLMQTLRADSVLPRLNVRMLDGGAGGDIVLPILAGSSAGWAADGDTLPALGETTSTVTLTPSRIGALVGLTSRTMATTDVSSLEASLARDMSSAVGSGIDAAFLAETAVSNAVPGLSGVTTTAVAGTNGTAVSRALLDAQLASLEAQNLPGSHWLINPEMARQLSLMVPFSTSQKPLLDIDADMPRLRGVPVIISRHVSNSGSKGSASNLHSVFCANWSQTVIGATWRSPVVEVGTSGDDFAQGSISLRIQTWLDIRAVRPTAISRVSHYALA
jgi:HK97 family phage major capsid protein